MRKPQTVSRTLAALAIAAVFALGVTALVTPEADAGNCLCPPDTFSVVQWGHGSTCAAARSNCAGNARVAAENECQSTSGGGVCQFVNLTYNQSTCYGWPKTIDCTQTFRCEECIQFP